MQNKSVEHNTDEEGSLTSRIDQLRWSISEQTIKNTEDRYSKICSITTLEQLKWEIRRCFPKNEHKIIRDFFIDHPVCWTDMQRKIHAFKKYDNEKKRWYIEDQHLWDIYASFLIRGRKSDIWEKLRVLLPVAVTENQELMIFAWAQPSLLDEWWFMFSKISSRNRKWHIKKLISNWLIRNLDNFTYENVGDYITTILPKLLSSIKEIFGKNIHLTYCKTFDDLVRTLDKMLASSHGEERENAFRLIQSFHAWSSIEEIERFHTLAREKIEQIPRKLKELWFIIEWDPDIVSHNDATIYQSRVNYQWKSYRIEWRVKTVKSILQKMWETEEYTNKDAIRDMIWISIIWADDTPLDEKKNIIIRFWKLMPDFWYLLKDKWWLWDELQSVTKSLKEHKKNPVHVSFKLKDTSNPHIKNTSISGFVSLWWENLWTEIQFSNESSADWKKKDDQVYKPKGMLKVLMRGPKFATPKDCYDLINERIKPGTLAELRHDSINSMILSYIENENFLIPHVSEGAKELLITCIAKEQDFKIRFPNMQRCNKWDKYYSKVKNRISQLK